jgi:hypothetical protein
MLKNTLNLEAGDSYKNASGNSRLKYCKGVVSYALIDRSQENG